MPLGLTNTGAGLTSVFHSEEKRSSPVGAPAHDSHSIVNLANTVDGGVSVAQSVVSFDEHPVSMHDCSSKGNDGATNMGAAAMLSTENVPSSYVVAASSRSNVEQNEATASRGLSAAVDRSEVRSKVSGKPTPVGVQCV